MRGNMIAGLASALLLVACASAPGGAPGPGTQAGSGTNPSPATTIGGMPGDPTATPGSGASSGVAACDLLTDGEIKQKTTHGVKSKEPGPQSIYENGCLWVLDNTPVEWQIVLGVRAPGGRAYYDTYLTSIAGSPIPGLGTDVAVEGPARSIMAVKGDVLVDLQYVSFDEGAKEQAVELMKAVLSRV